MDDSRFTLLGNFNDWEADIIESILRQLDIPVLKKYPDTGGYLKVCTGRSIFGISLYVPETELERAREAVENIPDHSNSLEENSQEENTEVEIEDKGESFSILGVFRIIARIYIAALFLYYIGIYLGMLFRYLINLLD